MTNNENLILEKEKELNKKEMNKINHAIKLSLIPGIICALIFAVYFAALPDEITGSIAIPIKASAHIETDTNGSFIGNYKSENAAPFKVIPLENLSYFEYNRMDRIFAISRYDKNGNKIWLLVRGIRYTDFPKVYDYYQEFEEPSDIESVLFKTTGLNLQIENNKQKTYSFFDSAKNQFLPFTGNKFGLPLLNNPKNSNTRYISIQHLKTRYAANIAAFVLLAGIFSSFAVFVILINKTGKKT